MTSILLSSPLGFSGLLGCNSLAESPPDLQELISCLWGLSCGFAPFFIEVPSASWEIPTLYSCPSCQVALPVPLPTPRVCPASLCPGGASKFLLPWECNTRPRGQQPWQGKIQLSSSPFWTFLRKAWPCCDCRANYKQCACLYPLLCTQCGNHSVVLS